MAKKSKRPPARKQQPRRPQQRPAFPQAGVSTAPVSEMPLEDAVQDDYAAGALPYTESDGPMPLPPPEVDEEEPAAPPASAPRPVVAAGPERRRVGRIDPAAAAAAAQRPGQRPKGRTTATAAMFEPLPPDDAAIPFDRVPYVPGDLRRVLIIAGLMVVLIVVADFVVNAIVK
jgi:hypothetical protein